MFVGAAHPGGPFAGDSGRSVPGPYEQPSHLLLSVGAESHSSLPLGGKVAFAQQMTDEGATMGNIFCSAG